MKCVKLTMTAIALAVAAAGLSTVNAAEQQLNPKAITIKLPDQIAWKRSAAGTNETAVLYGDPEKPGPYVLMFKWLPGNMSRPHWHPNDRMITVLKGTWWVGTGDKFDPDSTVPLPAGDGRRRPGHVNARFDPAAGTLERISIALNHLTTVVAGLVPATPNVEAQSR